MIQENESLLLNLITKLLDLEINNYDELLVGICTTIMKNASGVKLTSLLTYNQETDEIIYRVMDCCPILESKKANITKKIENNIILKLDQSTSGDLIKSDDNILIIDNVNFDKKYQSGELAEYLDLKKGIFIKIKELKSNKIHSVLIIYPEDNAPISNLSNKEFDIIAHVIESIISSAKRNREHAILQKILESAERLSKDLQSFLHKCVQIISDELSTKGCSIFVIDPVDNLVKLKATLGIKPGPALNDINEWRKADVYYKLGEGLTGRVAERNKLEVYHNVSIENSKWVEEEMSDNFLCIPIPKIDEQKAVGVIRCATKSNALLANKIETFNQEDIELINYISRLLSVFIELSFYQDSQKQIMTKMPHELKASLGNILSVCDFLRLITDRENLDKPFKKKIYNKTKDIIDECNLSLMTIDGASLFEEKIDHYDFQRTDIFTDIIAKIRKMLNPIAAADKKIVITYDNTIRLPKIFIDKHRMQLVFHNILINAIKYSFKQRKFHKKNYIEIKSKTTVNHYIIEISNIGIPVPKDKITDIFIYGIRSLEAVSLDPNGKGIGLALVKNILDNHGISIAVTHCSNPTKFELKIPISLTTTKPTIKQEEL